MVIHRPFHEPSALAAVRSNAAREWPFLLLLCCTFVSSGCKDMGSEGLPDDWKTSTAEEQHVNPDTLANLAARIAAGTYGEIHSLVIVRHGYLIEDRYFRGWNADQLHPLYSVTKSVTSSLFGALPEAHVMLDSTLPSLLPEYASVIDAESSSSRIRLQDLLTMRSGFAWDEHSTPYGDPRNPTSVMAGSPDWIRFVLTRPMADAPGTWFVYNSGCSVLLGGVLRSKTGMVVTKFAEARLFHPLGISRYRWETGPEQVTNTGWGLSLRPRDMARLGLLYLNEGAWKGERILSAEWLRDSWTGRVSLSNATSYGYQWWMLPLDGTAVRDPQTNGIRFAAGWGDQFIFVIPALDMVVVSTGGNYTGPVIDQAVDFVRSSIAKAVSD